MSIPLIVDNNSYQYPSQGDKANTGWGGQTTSWASAVTSALTKLGLGGTLSPIANAVINIDSTSKGILIPRMTTAQRDAITSPTNSLLIFNTTLKVVQYYDLSVSTWISIGARLPDNAIFSGTLQVNGNITGLGSLTLSGALQALTGNFTDTTDAVDVDTAPLKTAGGMAVKKKLFIGTDANIGGNANVTGNIYTGDGTVSLPSHSFTSDPDTGFYRISDGVMGFTSNGIKRGEFGAGYGGFTGNIIQVLSTVKSDTFTTTSLSYVDVTGFNLSITPKYNNSKILVIIDIGHLVAGSVCSAILLRNGTEIYSGDTASGKSPALHKIYNGNASDGDHFYGTWHHVSTFLDSPNTISPITYKIQIRADVAGSVFFNRNASDTDPYNGRTASSIILMEVQQ
jgi:hypothetical protein